MRALVVVVVDGNAEGDLVVTVTLKFFDAAVDLAAEGSLIEIL